MAYKPQLRIVSGGLKSGYGSGARKLLPQGHQLDYQFLKPAQSTFLHFLGHTHERVYICVRSPVLRLLRRDFVLLNALLVPSLRVVHTRQGRLATCRRRQVPPR